MSLSEQKPAETTLFPLHKRLMLCLVLVAMESYISFEEIYMLAVLQRADVPTSLVSLPGTLSSAIGVFIIPLLGWASDRLTRCTCLGQKRPFAMLTLTVITIGMSILIGVSGVMLYHVPDNQANFTNSQLPTVTSESAFPQRAVSNGTSSLRLPLRTGSSLPSFETSDGVTTAIQYNNTTISGRYDEMLAGMLQNSTPLGNNSGRGLDEAGQDVPPLGILGVVGFTLADHGYDSSFSTLKAYMLAVTPPSQHDSILVMATLLGAVGGCLTSLLGFLDLTSVFPEGEGILDKGVAQCIVQSLVLLASILIFGTCSLLIGSETPVLARPENGNFDGQKPSTTHRSNDDANRAPIREKREEAFEISSNYDETSRLVPDSKASTSGLCARASAVLKRNKRMIFLCLMTFLGLVTNYAYFVYVTNYVAQVIYDGDPYGLPGSTEYDNYVQGVHVGSLSMLTFYCVFVVFNIFHSKILEMISMRTEYVVVTVICAALILTLALTDNLVVLFVNALIMATYRSVVYTIPFILSNNYSKQE
ncbi:hypothetical protein BaRGS_00025723, partial [Batillaria attramentaria]